MAVNVLLYSWLKGDLLETETPAEVKEIVEKASQWLIQNTLSGKYKLWNAVFSGSVKTVDVKDDSFSHAHECTHTHTQVHTHTHTLMLSLLCTYMYLSTYL